MGIRLRIYCLVQTEWHVGGGPGAKVPGAAFELKLKFSVLFCPILASAITRQLPWTSGPTYIAQLRRHDMWDGARYPNSLGRF